MAVVGPTARSWTYGPTVMPTGLSSTVVSTKVVVVVVVALEQMAGVDPVKWTP